MPAGVLIGVVLAIALSATAGAAPGEPDCTGPAGDPEPGTAAWHQRENDNANCGEQRADDAPPPQAPPAATAELCPPPGRGGPGPPSRAPPLWQNVRFRYEPVSFK